MGTKRLLIGNCFSDAARFKNPSSSSKCETNDLEVPANADCVIGGYVDPPPLIKMDAAVKAKVEKLFDGAA